MRNRIRQSFWRNDWFYDLHIEEHLSGKRSLLPHEWNIAFSPVKKTRRSPQARRYRLYLTHPIKRHYAKTRLARTHMGMEMAPAQWKQMIRSRARQTLREAVRDQPLEELDVWFPMPWTW
ncbi:hypothetical protein DC3_46610 [Deinococcus cellulosilyticus NBRC 106333 = KACC 11606]|uniref:Uncharacterized protein n=1 Tax=Deinococcus cellulosilyticus (strain DSM 18568 / NBRC 106333 / KACC 11606 / 5516J-15) TaxID=1223518 RepID=A0A511N960_DEIC1|nr:hypothetical protein DC3_46610 [Deinococcus cellulosilyticus NBRC 106333 = KACC 11606]